MPKDFKGGDDILGRILKNQERKKAKEAAKAYQGGGWRGMKKEGETADPGWVRKMSSPNVTSHDPFMLALRSVVRAANVLQNAEEGKQEQLLQVVWSGGEQSNNVKDNCVYLSPDVVAKETTLKPEWTFDERVDVLSGDAIMLSTMKRFATESAQRAVSGNTTAEQLWYTLETLNAEVEVLTDFPGFSKYFSTVRTYYSDKNAKDMLEQRIQFCDAIGQPDMEGALAALKFEMLYPDQTLDLPPAYREAIDHCKSVMADTETSDERATASLDVSDYLTKRFPPPPPQGGGGGDGEKGDNKEKSEGGGGGGGSGEGDSEEDENEGDGEGEGENDEQDKDEDKDQEGDGKDGEDKKDEKKDKGEDKKDNKGKDGKDKENKPQDGNANKKPKLPNIGQARAKFGEAVKNQSNKKIAGKSVSSEDVVKTPNPEVAMSEEDAWTGGVIETDMTGLPSEYRSALVRLKGRINTLKNHIKLQAEQVVFYHHGLKSGSLDDGSLFKIGIDRKDDCLFEQREIKARPKLVFGILADESGSMQSGHRYAMVRDLTIILANAFKEFEGLELCVVGHTTEGAQLWMRNYYTPEHHAIDALAGIRAYAENLDGHAMHHFARSMLKWYPDIEQRHMIVVSDGQPSGPNYGGSKAMDHMRDVVGKARAWGVNIFGCGIDNAYSWDTGERMYGPNNFVILPDTYSAIPMLGKYITKIIKKANVLR